MKVILFWVLSISIFVGAVSRIERVGVFAQTQDLERAKVEYESVNPGDDYKFILKRLREKIELFLFSFSPSRKANYYSKLVDVRLSELKYVVERKDIANFQTASQRYSATAGNATDFVLKKGTKEDRERLVEKFQNHIPVIVKLQEPYIPDNSQWRFLQDDINSLKSYISKLSE